MLAHDGFSVWGRYLQIRLPFALVPFQDIQVSIPQKHYYLILPPTPLDLCCRYIPQKFTKIQTHSISYVHYYKHQNLRLTAVLSTKLSKVSHPAPLMAKAQQL